MKLLIIVIAIVIVALLSYFGVKKIKARQDNEGPLISIVYLLKTPRSISEQDIRNTVSKAFGITFDPKNEEAKEFVISLSSPMNTEIECFMLKVNGSMYIINSSRVAYMKNPEKFSESIADGRLRSAIKKHSAWISVDAMGELEDITTKTQAYRDIAKMIAQLADKDCLAIYCPELEQCNEYDDKLLEMLRSEEPLSLFDEPTFAPVLKVNGDDPRMANAVNEARKRWPEFVNAFQNNLNKDAPFLVKGEFKEGGNSEFMWVTVTAIDDDNIHGVLENKPNELTNINQGQKVIVSTASLSDWLFAKDEEAIGGFTIKVIEKIREGR